MAQTLTPLFAVVAALLVAAGIAKLRSPGPMAVGASPAGPAAARVVGVAELALGIAALAAPRPLTAALVTVAYLGFAGQVSRTLATDADAGCGCFGAADVPANRSHVVLNLGCAAVAAVAVADVPHGIGWIVTRPPATAAVLVLGIAAATYAAYLAFTALPAAWGAFGGRRA